MTEQELRNKVISIANSYSGYNEDDGSAGTIIDKYNSIRPDGGYVMTHTDPWCAAFASVCGHEAGLSAIIPINCSCEGVIDGFKNMGRWEEDGNITPQTGDYILYNWNENCQPNQGFADHIGIVEGVSDGVISVIEGNKSDAVEKRQIDIGNGFIRGFGLPDYVSMATGQESTQTAQANYTVVSGDTLSKIASKFGTTYQAIAELNGIADPNVIYAGQVLLINSTPTNDYYPYEVQVTATALNVRDGSGTNFAVVDSIGYGSVTSIYDECKGIGASKWGKTDSGWISLDYVKRI